MATDDPVRTGWTPRTAHLGRAYKWLTGLALVVYLVALFLPPVIPSIVTNAIVGVWLLGSVFAFAYVGIENSTHGV